MADGQFARLYFADIGSVSSPHMLGVNLYAPDKDQLGRLTDLFGAGRGLRDPNSCRSDGERSGITTRQIDELSWIVVPGSPRFPFWPGDMMLIPSACRSPGQRREGGPTCRKI